MPVDIGQKYGKLTPRYDTGKRTKNRNKIFYCDCDCGGSIEVPSASLTSGNTQSCGCLLAESLKEHGEKIRQRNKYDLSGDYGVGFASNTNKEFYFDLEDYDIIKNYHWMEKGDEGYIVAKVWNNNKPSTVFLHRLIMQENGYNINGLDVDHINHKTHDNRKSELRVCEHYKNIVASKTYTNNTSGRKGVSWDKSRNLWTASITVNKKTHHLGRFANFDDAVKAREEAEKKYHKEYHYDDTKLIEKE